MSVSRRREVGSELNISSNTRKGTAVTHKVLRGLSWLCFSMVIAWSQPVKADDVQGDPPSSDAATLSRLVALALQNAPKVVVGRAATRASQASVLGAKLWPVQNPYFEVTGTRTTNSFRGETTFLGSLWLPFELTGQRGRRISEAEAYVAMHELDVQQARAQASGAAVRAWGRALVELSRIRTLHDIAASAASEARAFRARRDVGDATERDAQLAEVELARHQMMVEESKVALQSALAEMQRLTGRTWYVPPQDHVRTERDLNRLDAAAAAEQSPFVRVGRAEADYFARQDERLSSETAGPISLMLSGGHGTTGENILGGGVAFTLPTFRRYQGERARAKGERDRALIQTEVTRKDLERRLLAIIQEARGVRQIEEVLDGKALPAAKAARSAAEQMFEMGKVDILSVLVSRRDEALLRLKQLDLAEREWELLADWAELTGVVP
jgi:outer membrane protein, heavy metal efflux system